MGATDGQYADEVIHGLHGASETLNLPQFLNGRYYTQAVLNSFTGQGCHQKQEPTPALSGGTSTPLTVTGRSWLVFRCISTR